MEVEVSHKLIEYSNKFPQRGLPRSGAQQEFSANRQWYGDSLDGL